LENSPQTWMGGEMKKKLVLASALLVPLLFLSGAPILAASGIDAWRAYTEALEYGLRGLKEYFSFIVELYKVVTS